MVVGEFTTEVDVMVIGAGPGGYVAAIRAAQLGKKVVIVDKGNIGGVCLNRGCIPSKALISVAHQYELMENTSDIGINTQSISIDFNRVQEWKKKVVQKLTGGVRGLLKGNSVQIVKGEALFIDKNKVRVIDGYDVNTYLFNHCIIATGSRPIELKAIPFGDKVLSSTEILELDAIPKSLVIIGGGYIGIELGQMLSKFGTKVTILEGEKSILSGFEKDVSKWVTRKLKKQGVQIITGAFAKSSEQTDTNITVTYSVDGEENSITADYVLVTVGRRPNFDELGLDMLPIKFTENGLIKIDDQCRTNVPNIYAIGDIVEGPALAHKASYEGKVAAEAIAGLPSTIDYKVIPAVVFSDPEVASVGLSETEAINQGYAVQVGKFPYGANGRALTMNIDEGFVKIIANKVDGRVLGAQIVGPEASNLVAEMVLAIEMDATLEDISLTIHAHPTLGELTMESAEFALGFPVHVLNK